LTNIQRRPRCSKPRVAWRRHDLLDTGRLDFFHPRDRNPHLGLEHRHEAGERAGSDPDDRIGLTVDPNRAAEHLRIAAVVAAPRRVREDHSPRRAGAIVVGQQRAAERGADAQHLEVIAGDDFPDRHARSIAGLHRGDRGAEPHHRGEDFVLPGEVEEVRVGAGRVGIAVPSARVDAHQAIGPFDRQRPEQQRVHDREECRVEADANRQRGDRHDGEGGRTCEPSQGVADIGTDGFEQSHLRIRQHIRPGAGYGSAADAVGPLRMDLRPAQPAVPKQIERSGEATLVPGRRAVRIDPARCAQRSDRGAKGSAAAQ
jgi:hypothetical protein